MICFKHKNHPFWSPHVKHLFVGTFHLHLHLFQSVFRQLLLKYQLKSVRIYKFHGSNGTNRTNFYQQVKTTSMANILVCLQP